MPDGTLTVTPGAETFQGAVTPDGRFAMMSGETTGASGPQFVFLLK